MLDPVHATPEEFENAALFLRLGLPSTLIRHENGAFPKRSSNRRNFKTQQSPVILDLCLRKTRFGKSHDYRDAIVPEKLRFQIVFRPRENLLNKKPAFSDSSGLKSVFVKLRFRDGLVWRT